MVKQTVVLGLAIVLLLIAGCSEVENLQTQFCQNVEKLEDSLESLEAIDADSKLEDMRNAGEKLDKALGALDTTGIDLGLGGLDEIQESFRTLQTEMQDAEDAGSLEETADEIQQAVAKLREAYDKLHRKVCGSGD